MSKSNRIIVAAISATAALCIVVALIASIMTKSQDVTPTSAQSTTVFTDPSTGETIVSAEASTSTYTTIPTAPTTTEPVTQDISTLIIGKWMDSAGMSGYEFFPDGKVSFTAVDLSKFLGIPFSVPIDNGRYTVEDSLLIIKFSIYTATIEKKYEISIENDVLSMRNVEERDTATYARVASSTQSTSAAESTQYTTAPVSATDPYSTTVPYTSAVQSTVPEGVFVSGDNEKKLTFNLNGTVTVEIKKDTFGGVYQITGSKLLIVYIDDGDSISEEYEYTLNGNILTLVSSKGESSVYIKQ